MSAPTPTIEFNHEGLFYVVVNENTLGIIRDGFPNQVEVLAGSVIKGGPDPLSGPVAFSPTIERFRPATVADFNEYRVSPVGHLV